MWRAGDREAASSAALEKNVEVLPRMKLEPFDHRQAQEYLHDVRCQRHHPRDATRERFDLDIGHARNQPCLNDEIRASASLAE